MTSVEDDALKVPGRTNWSPDLVGATSVFPCESYNTTDHKFHVNLACRVADSSTMF
jgi:hypothetical protein